MRTTFGLASMMVVICAGACTEGSDPDPMMDPDPDPEPGPVTFGVKIENVAYWTLLKSGVQPIKVGSSTPGPLGMGDAYEVTFTAGKGQRVSFATMLGESNDWFFGPGEEGIALYDADGQARSGDVTGEVYLWDAGTEIDEEPGVGDSVGPRQSTPDQGEPDPIGTVRQLGDTIALSDGTSFARPAIAEMIRVTLAPASGQRFTLRVENVSTMETLVTSQGMREIHLSPVVWAVHVRTAPLFSVGAADRGQGLEQVAESGRSAMLALALGALSGAATPISPGVFVVHDVAEPIFSLGLADRDLGLERIAEDGRPQDLGAAMAVGSIAEVSSSGVFDMPAGATEAGPARPGGAFELEVVAEPGQRLSFATMFGMSNDWFFASRPDGIALFDDLGRPLSGDVTDDVGLFDAGTEIDQELAIGPDVGPQQSGPDTGPADPIAQVREVPAARYGQPTSAHLRVTITPR